MIQSFRINPTFSAAACFVMTLASVSTGQEETGVALRVPSVSSRKDAPPPEELTYKTPKGWRNVEAGNFLTAKFEIGQGEQVSTVVIAALQAPAGGLAANINRWRVQVGLEPLKEEEAEKLARKTKVDDSTGHVIDLMGTPRDSKVVQRLLAAFVTRGDKVWFFKMMGPADQVGKEQPAFDAFLKSVRFSRP